MVQHEITFRETDGIVIQMVSFDYNARLSEISVSFDPSNMPTGDISVYVVDGFFLLPKHKHTKKV